MLIRSYLFALLIIFLTSSVSVALLLLYMNPMTNPEMAFILLGIGLFLVIASVSVPIIFFIKKVYYRGDVSMATMNASVRQGVLLSAGVIFMGAMHLYRVDDLKMILALWATIGCIEVMIQAVE